ncbi:MAG: tetratricopeptide repeat protein [Pseudomonadota bacterium]
MTSTLSTTCFSVAFIALASLASTGWANAGDMAAAVTTHQPAAQSAVPVGGHPLTHNVAKGPVAKPSLDATTTASIVAPRKRITDARTSELLQTLIAAKTQRVGKRIEQTLMRHWRKPPNPAAARLYRAANRVGQMGDMGMAVTMFDLLEDKAPNWPEVYAQRAYFKYRMGRYKAALKDIEIALELQPAHFVALSGKFYALVALREPEAAQEALELAVTIHPWMSERKLLEKMQTESTNL